MTSMTRKERGNNFAHSKKIHFLLCKIFLPSVLGDYHLSVGHVEEVPQLLRLWRQGHVHSVQRRGREGKRVRNCGGRRRRHHCGNGCMRRLQMLQVMVVVQVALRRDGVAAIAGTVRRSRYLQHRALVGVVRMLGDHVAGVFGGNFRSVVGDGISVCCCTLSLSPCEAADEWRGGVDWGWFWVVQGRRRAAVARGGGEVVGIRLRRRIHLRIVAVSPRREMSAGLVGGPRGLRVGCRRCGRSVVESAIEARPGGGNGEVATRGVPCRSRRRLQCEPFFRHRRRRDHQAAAGVGGDMGRGRRRGEVGLVKWMRLRGNSALRRIVLDRSRLLIHLFPQFSAFLEVFALQKSPTEFRGWRAANVRTVRRLQLYRVRETFAVRV